MAKEKRVEFKATEKPAKNLSKVTKRPRAKKETKTDRMAEMVTISFNRLANLEGITLAKIRRYIETTFSVEMTKPNQTIIKKVIRKGFREGRIEMTNDNASKIDLTKRFRMVDESDMESDETDESEESMRNDW